MQGNGQQAGKGREDHLDGVAAADGGLQTAAVPMLPAMEVAEEPEKPPGGKSKDPNTYKVLSLVRAGAPWGRAGGAGSHLAGGSGGAVRLAQVFLPSPSFGRWETSPLRDLRSLSAVLEEVTAFGSAGSSGCPGQQCYGTAPLRES